ncbi:ATP-binding protein [Caulobacter sp. S45]|uniref:ATP-binding protein n=1 Tax=Caulobacter sp. S45 TaxID=1641861 RepID=UPI00131D9F4A|nr:ATP-binding protein [Caulobacter sp. S45]
MAAADGSGSSHDVFQGGGELGALMRSHDWTSTPLGPTQDWPRSLQSIVRMMLTSRYQMWMAWGPELTFFCNDAYSPTLGVKHPWALGKPAKAVWAEIWPDIGPLIDHVLKAGEATYSEGMLLFLERSGFPEETYHTFSYSPLFDDAGAIAGMFCVVVEETERVITERRMGTLRELASSASLTKTEDELFQAVTERLSQNLTDLPFTLTYLFDEDGTTARLVAQSGIEPDHPAAPVLTPRDGLWPLQGGGARVEAILVGDLAARFGALPSGTWDRPPEQALLAPIPQQAKDQDPAGFLVVGLNPFRSRDQGYQGFVELLAGQIAAALAAARAYEAERRRAEALAEIDRAKTAFFSNVSHEFRTPLTLMLGPLEDVLAGDDVETGGTRAQLEVAHRNAQRLLHLVNSLLDFSRIEAGRMQASFTPTDLAAFSAEIASGFRSAMERVGLNFTIEAEPLAQPVLVDRVMWEKVLLNLLSNAFKFTFEGGVSIRIASTPDGRCAQVQVQDTGVGVPQHELTRLFERFHRVEGTRGRTFEGSGIGLALVQELVKLHGGTISAQSAEGEGATFTILIPFGENHLPKDQIQAQAPAMPLANAHVFVEEALRWGPVSDDAAAGAVQGPLPGAGKRILLADDNADMREYVRRLLNGQGYEVDVVGDGEAALAAAQRRAPDLMLSDVMMPKLDGFGLLRAIRSEPGLTALPVILLSARAGEEAKVQGLGAGADDYLTKPFTARELLARVAANIKLSEIRSEAEKALREQTRALTVLNRAGSAVAADLDLGRVVQTVTDAGVELTGAEFGAFFYNVLNEAGEHLMLYCLSGAPKEAFASFPMPRNTAIFAPTFGGERVIRSDDITRDPLYGLNTPHKGMPEGHLPVRSYLAVPVKSRSGEVLGGLFFGHSKPSVFGAQAEDIMSGLAAQAAISIDNARLFQAAQQEISQRRAAEEELQSLNLSLEARVADEVAERMKAEDALRQAQKMEALGQLTGGVAHDFNNLLTVIIGGLDTIRRIGVQDSVRLTRSLDMATQSAQRAATLTARLLAFSRRQPLKPTPLDLNAVVRDSTELLHRTLGETIELEGVLAPRLWPVELDQNQLESAILNLAVNARDAMPEGGKLTIETGNTMLDESYTATDTEVVPGQYAVLSISDNGEGMSRDILNRVFEPFYTTKDVGKGTGLGLSMVYGFVKQSGGHVTVYSETGEGTTVKLYFPRFRGDLPSTEIVQDLRAPEGLKEEVILVVEDNEDVRAYSVMILNELGYAVLEAGDADAALTILNRSGRIDLLFTDVVLPGRNGRVLADAARSVRPDLRVLFTTGYSRNAIVHQGRLDAGVQLVTKPFTFEQLASRVRDVLDG